MKCWWAPYGRNLDPSLRKPRIETGLIQLSRMATALQADGRSFRTVYYLGSGAKFIACVMFPVLAAIFLAKLLSDPLQLKDALFAWRTNFVGGVVVLGGLGLWVWVIAVLFWIPLRCFAFPKVIEGVLLAASVYEFRKERRPIAEITIGDEKLRTHTNPDLVRILQTIPCGSH